MMVESDAPLSASDVIAQCRRSRNLNPGIHDHQAVEILLQDESFVNLLVGGQKPDGEFAPAWFVLAGEQVVQIHRKVRPVECPRGYVHAPWHYVAAVVRWPSNRRVKARGCGVRESDALPFALICHGGLLENAPIQRGCSSQAKINESRHLAASQGGVEGDAESCSALSLSIEYYFATGESKKR
jgi:TPR repeat protein